MRKRWMGLAAGIVATTVWFGFKLDGGGFEGVADSTAGSHSIDIEHTALSEVEPKNTQEQSLLDNPTVQQYLKRRSDKLELQDYFNDPINDPERAQAVLALIEKTEAEGGVLAFEAMHLKMAWLEKNKSDRASFEVAAKALVAEYREKSQIGAEKFNPENTPEFKNYKAQELKIIQDVNELEVIPRGLTREAYLREKLMAARMTAYGEDGEGRD